MSRPRLSRRIEFDPQITYFKPQGIPLKSLKSVELSLEEFEAFRWRHANNLNQEEAAEKMATSQSTYQRILSSASKKIAQALVEGQAIKIIKK